jgi:hypothetical protein
MSTQVDSLAEEQLLQPSAGTFEPAELDGLPEPVRRHLQRSIAPGTPVARAARLEMRGQIRIGRWLPFRARELLAPQRGFVWRARVAGVVSGEDRFVGGAGAMRWKLAGIVPLVRADGPDVSRSAAGRAGGESLWLPTAVLPRFGVLWSTTADDRITARFDVDGTPIEMEYGLDGAGRTASFVYQRWGDPDRTGTWAWHPCGGEITAHRSFGGLTIPTAGQLGWHYGTDRWPDGAFFRYEITALDIVGGG